MNKLPVMDVTNVDGNIFSVLAEARKVLRANNMVDKIEEMTSRTFKTESYTEALAVVMEYVDMTCDTSEDEDLSPCYCCGSEVPKSELKGGYCEFCEEENKEYIL